MSSPTAVRSSASALPAPRHRPDAVPLPSFVFPYSAYNQQYECLVWGKDRPDVYTSAPPGTEDMGAGGCPSRSSTCAPWCASCRLCIDLRVLGRLAKDVPYRKDVPASHVFAHVMPCRSALRPRSRPGEAHAQLLRNASGTLHKRFQCEAPT